MEDGTISIDVPNILSEDAGTLALKIKLDLSREQEQLLNKAFWTWASLCTRVGANAKERKKALESLKEKQPAENQQSLWFNKTQLTQVGEDLKNLDKALKRQKIRFEYSLDRAIARRDVLQAALDDPTKREYSSENKSIFRPKKWAESGLLKARFHYARHYQTKIKEANKLIEKKHNTLKKLDRGRFSFNPTRICLWKDLVKINFFQQKAELNPFLPRTPTLVGLLLRPKQPLRGSSLKSAGYLKSALSDLAAYSINAMLFGLSNSEKMLAKAKHPEKIAKRDEKRRNKIKKWPSKKKALEKLVGRPLLENEAAILDSVENYFASTFKVNHTPEYLSVLGILAGAVLSRDAFVCLNKYPVLLRSPKLASKHKRPKNRKPDEWDYFIQFGYSPVLSQTREILPKTIMGIDRGVSSLVAVSILDPKTNSFIFNKLWPGNVAALKRKDRKLRAAIRNLERKIRAQHNVHLHENQIQKQLRGTKNRINAILHRVSAEIVETAKKHQSLIVLERLRDMRQHARKKNRFTAGLNYALSLFDYEKIAQYVFYKAKREGIPVFEVRPENTSKTCAICLLRGHSLTNYERSGAIKIKKMTKDGTLQEVVHTTTKIGVCRCHECASPRKEYVIDADLNAARVIALCKHKNLNYPLPFGEDLQRKG